MQSVNPRRVGAADIAIGQRIRAARLAARISQEKLAEALDVSFQQVQKYENGINRVGAGRLGVIATTLNVPVTQLLGAEDAPASSATLTLMTTREGQQLAEAFNSITDSEARRAIVNIAEIVAGVADGTVNITGVRIAGIAMQAAE